MLSGILDLSGKLMCIMKNVETMIRVFQEKIEHLNVVRIGHFHKSYILNIPLTFKAFAFLILLSRDPEGLCTLYFSYTENAFFSL